MPKKVLLCFFVFLALGFASVYAQSNADSSYIKASDDELANFVLSKLGTTWADILRPLPHKISVMRDVMWIKESRPMNGKWFIFERGVHRNGQAAVGSDVTLGPVVLYPASAGNYVDPKMSTRFQAWFKTMQEHISPFPQPDSQFDVRGIDMPVVMFIDQTPHQERLYSFAVTPDRKSILQAYSWLLDETK